MKNHLVVEIAGDNRTTVDYRMSMSEDGPMYFAWAHLITVTGNGGQS